MKILFAADIFPPVGGGPAIYAAGFSNALVEMGDEATVVSLTPDSRKDVTGATVVAVTQKNKLLRYFEYFGLLLRHARKADLVFAMGPVNAGLPALFAARLLGKKFVVKVVGDYAWEQGFQRFGVTELIDEFQTKKYHGSVRRLQIVQKFVARSADMVIVPSEYLKKIVIGWDVLADKVKVIYNAIDLEKIGQGMVGESKVVGFKDSNEFWILTGPRLVPWKGIKALINVLRKISVDFPKVKLKIFGDGPERGNYEGFAKTLGMSSKVEFLGFIPNSEVHTYMHNSEIFILNSAYEGLSHVLVESLYAGCNVLASNVGGNPEIIIPGKTGDLFEYNNEQEIELKLREIVGGKKISVAQDTEAGKEFFTKFDFGVMVKVTRKLLHDICVR
ncbi:MAG: glycosyltransferase family 4 protein [Candidatus Magasanikbacteria bacterium]|nr:glycosyltransferase family 4 protein [Candidatus Magasanikbacteria bacterium]